MTLWFVFALMTVAAIFAVLWPLGRSARAQNQGSEVVVYKDQLTEIERDLASGLIAAPEAEAARVEISRRLLAAAGSEPVSEPKSSLKWRRAAAVLALVGLPLVAIGVYMPLGSPRLQDFPLAQRERGSGSGMAGSLENLVVQVEQHLEKNPTDGRGWNVLAPVLERLGRFDDAVRAYRNSITYNGESPERRSDLGEAISAAAGGVVTAEAKTEFERAACPERRRSQGELLPRSRRRAGRPQGRCRHHLARAAGQGSGGCAVAAPGAVLAGAGRRRHDAGTVR
ncbi:cytochrome c-type biogenesis protein CcmI [Bradyrhizobium diazoefficiens]